MEERSEREKKKKNLIIFNIEESNHETLQERNREESDFCETLFKEIGSDIQTVDIVEVVRLGKGGRRVIEGREQTESPKPRPLLVKVKDTTLKWDIIQKTKNLKNT